MSKVGTVPLHSLIEQTAVKWHQPSALRFHSATISLLKVSISTSTASRGPEHLIFYVLQAASWWGSEQKCSGVGHWCDTAISESLCCLLSVTLKSVLHSTDVKAPTSISAQERGFMKTPPRKSQAIYGSNVWEKPLMRGSRLLIRPRTGHTGFVWITLRMSLATCQRSFCKLSEVSGEFSCAKFQKRLLTCSVEQLWYST